MKFTYRIEIFDSPETHLEQGDIEAERINEACETIVRKHSDLLCPVMQELCEDTTVIDSFRLTDREYGALVRDSHRNTRAVVILEF